MAAAPASSGVPSDYVPHAQITAMLTKAKSGINDAAKVIFDESGDQPKTVLTRSAMYQDIAKSLSIGTPSLQRASTLYLREQLVKMATAEIEPRFTLLAKAHHEGTAFVHAVLAFFSKCEVFVKYMKVFGSVDAQLKNQLQKPALLEDELMKCVHGHIYEKYRGRVMGDLIDRLDRHRDGDQVDSKAIHAAVTYFVQLSPLGAETEDVKRKLFDDHFFGSYKAATEAYYRKKRQTIIANEGALSYTTLPRTILDSVDFERRLLQEVRNSASGHSQATIGNRMDLLAQRVAASLAGEDFMWDKSAPADTSNKLCSHKDFGVQRMLEEARQTPARAAVITTLYKVMEFLGKIEGTPKPGQTDNMCPAFREYTKVVATELCDTFDQAEETKKETDIALMESLVSLHSYVLTTIIRTCCASSPELTKAMEAGFKDAVGKRSLKRKEKKGTEIKQRDMPMGELIGFYVDYLARGEIESAAQDDAGIRTLLEGVSAIVMFVSEKDVFLDCHKARLAKRLLQKPSAYKADVDQVFISLLQRLLGQSSTVKLTSMFTDMDTNVELAKNFEEYQARSTTSLSTRATAMVLTAGSWPSYSTDKFNPPDSLQQFYDAFLRFYKTRYQAKKLSWCGVLGTATCELDLPQGKYTPNMTVFQAGILLAIDQSVAVSGHGIAIRDLAGLLNLDVAVVKSSLASMVMNKVHQIVNRVDPEGNELAPAINEEPNSRYAVNPKFKSAKKSFTLAQAQMNANAGQADDEELLQRRYNVIDACIVRVMKSRRTLQMTDLQSLVIDQTQAMFSAQPKWIKQRIEKLIEREYLRRDEEAANTFHYLA